MNKRTTAKADKAAAILVKKDPASPAIMLVDTNTPAIKAGTVFFGRKFTQDTTIPAPREGFVAGADYHVLDESGDLRIARVTGKLLVPDNCLGGFHFAPGGNAKARSGGSGEPSINPQSMWDQQHRFAGADQRGMALVEKNTSRYWGDIYLTAKDHMEGGTSQFGVTIADGDDPPQNPTGGYFKKCDYATVVAVMAHHGKTLMSTDEFRDGAYGVTEKTALGNDPKITGLDAARTSWCGWMQAAGGLWVWCHDGDPDTPRASVAGGSWLNVDYAGSQYADVDYWPDGSDGALGARGRGDHLQLV